MFTRKSFSDAEGKAFTVDGICPDDKVSEFISQAQAEFKATPMFANLTLTVSSKAVKIERAKKTVAGTKKLV